MCRVSNTSQKMPPKKLIVFVLSCSGACVQCVLCVCAARAPAAAGHSVSHSSVSRLGNKQVELFFFQVRCEHLVWILQPGESIFLQFRPKNDFKAFFSLVSQFETHTCGKKTKKKKFSTRLLLPSLPSLCFFPPLPRRLIFIDSCEAQSSTSPLTRHSSLPAAAWQIKCDGV